MLLCGLRSRSRLRLRTGVLGLDEGDELVFVDDVAVSRWGRGGRLGIRIDDSTSVLGASLLLLLLEILEAKLVDLLRNYNAGSRVSR